MSVRGRGRCPRARIGEYAAALLRDGDRRNVVDRYRYWRRDAIVADLDTRRHDFHVAIENWQHDFNIGTVVRTANAFLAAEVHIVGGGGGTGAAPWSPTATSTCATTRPPATSPPAADARGRPAARHRQPARLRAPGDDGAAAAGSASSSARRARVSPGARREACDGTFSIAQFGSTRSINASAAAAIAMHTWITAYADLTGEDAWRG